MVWPDNKTSQNTTWSNGILTNFVCMHIFYSKDRNFYYLLNWECTKCGIRRKDTSENTASQAAPFVRFTYFCFQRQMRACFPFGCCLGSPWLHYFAGSVWKTHLGHLYWHEWQHPPTASGSECQSSSGRTLGPSPHDPDI